MQGIEIKVPEDLIKDVIMGEIARQFPPDKQRLMFELVVKNALGQQKDRYSNTSFFQDTINTMVREVAKEVFKNWIEQNRKEIESALFNYLNDNKQARLTEFCESLAENITAHGIEVKLDLREKKNE